MYAAQPHVIHHTTVVQPNSIPSAIYPAPVAAPRTNGVAMGMVAGTTMAMSAGKRLPEVRARGSGGTNPKMTHAGGFPGRGQRRCLPPGDRSEASASYDTPREAQSSFASWFAAPSQAKHN